MVLSYFQFARKLVVSVRLICEVKIMHNVINRLTRTTAMISLTVFVASTQFMCPTSAAPQQTAKGLGKSDLAKVKGEVGIAVIDASRKKQYFLNEEKPFPMQSVCKFPISIAVLRLADAGKLSVSDKVTITMKDIVPSHSPIKSAIKDGKSEFTIRELITRAVCDSDNTACDILIDRAGGTSEVTRTLVDAGINNVRIDRPEGRLQPESRDISKFLDDPRDTASPAGMNDLLQKLYSGSLLSKKSTALILEDLFNCKTGGKRLTAGLPKGWKLAHKTGTGIDVSGQSAGTNDVGIMVGPKGETIFVSVFTKGSRAKLAVREALIAKVAARATRGTL